MLNFKACEGMKHAIMINGECTHEGVHKNILSVLRFLKLDIYAYDVWDMGFL